MPDFGQELLQETARNHLVLSYQYFHFRERPRKPKRFFPIGLQGIRLIGPNKRPFEKCVDTSTPALHNALTRLYLPIHMKKFLFLLMSASISQFLFGSGEPLEVGTAAPDVTALDQDGQPVSLGVLYQTGYVLVYFYPKADTPGCTKQACSLRDEYEALADQGVTIVGVSTDSPEAQKKFQKKYSLPFILLADTDKKVVNAFGVPAATGFAARQAYLINDGTVVWRDLSASTSEQASDVLAVLAEME
jgi:thioredoxin-dependent peroxiredoxin